MIRRAAEKALDDNYSLTIKMDTLQRKQTRMQQVIEQLTSTNRGLEEKNLRLTMENLQLKEQQRFFDQKLHKVVERYQHDKEDKYLKMEHQIKQAVKIADDYQHEVCNLTRHIEKLEREKQTLEELMKANFAEIKELKNEKTLRDNQLALTD